MVYAREEMWCGSALGLIQVFDIVTKKSKTIIDTNKGVPIRCLFHENEKIWVCLENEILRINLVTREVIDSLEGARINAVVKPTDYTVWAASSDSTITVFDCESGKILTKLSDHKDFVFTLMALDGYVWSGGWDCKIRIWDAHDFKLVNVLQGHKQPLNTINVIPIELPISALAEESQPEVEVSVPESTNKSSFNIFPFQKGAFTFFSPSSPKGPSQRKPVQSTPNSRTYSSSKILYNTSGKIDNNSFQYTTCIVDSVWSTSWEGCIIMWI